MTPLRKYLLLIYAGFITALCLSGFFHNRKAPDMALLPAMLQAQRRADSVQALLGQWQQQRRIDSLTHLLRKRDELDSMRANAGLSTLDAMRQINGAIRR